MQETATAGRCLQGQRPVSQQRAPHRRGGRTPGQLARKVRLRQRKSRQNDLCWQERPGRPTKRFVSALISFRNVVTGLPCLVTQVLIGSKPSDSFSLKQAA